MIEAKPYPDETQRLNSLRKLHLLDTPIEERFERITRMVCRLMDVPIALFNLVDEHRQHYKSVQGLTNTDASLDAAFCTHVLHEEDMMLIPNALVDERFFDNPFVKGKYLNIGFYAGCPVRAPDGMPIGTLCAIDTKPRDMTTEQLDALRDLAAMVETELKVASLSRAQTNLITELGEAQRQAAIDPLTRLWNRSGMESLLAREWSDARRHGKPITLVMGDIDHFKTINDTFGHPAGDAVLRAVAKKIVESLRGEDAIGRMGGEEFLILLADCDPEQAFETIDRIRHSIGGEPIKVGDDRYPVTMSFGCATLTPAADDDWHTIIKRADIALYQAKRNGRNRVELSQAA